MVHFGQEWCADAERWARMTYVRQTQTDCLICNKQASGDALGCGVIYEDDLVFASRGSRDFDGQTVGGRPGLAGGA